MKSSTSKETVKRKPRLEILVPIFGLIFLAFVFGAVITEFRIFPYRMFFERAFKYVHAHYERVHTLALARSEGENVPANGKVTVPAKPQALDGYTFLTFDSARPSTARLLDMAGNIVHEWHKPLADIFPDHPLSKEPFPEYSVAWRFAQLFPNGDIIVSIKAYGDSPEGVGLVKFDKDSNVLWKIADHFHHHFSVADDGRIFALVHEWRDMRQHPVPGGTYFPDLALDDFVVEISPDGKELSRVSILDALMSSGYRELVSSSILNLYNNTYKWDRIHPNDVEIITADFAKKHPFMKSGMVMISLRDVDALILLDMKEKKVTWMMRGAWQRQHDPSLLENGNILIFDNRGDDVDGPGSRVLEVNPETNHTAWSYAGDREHRFRSDASGGAQRLANGNVLISDDDSGRVFEVTPAGEIVWEFRDVRVHKATRITKGFLKFMPTKLATTVSSR